MFRAYQRSESGLSDTSSREKQARYELTWIAIREGRSWYWYWCIHPYLKSSVCQHRDSILRAGCDLWHESRRQARSNQRQAGRRGCCRKRHGLMLTLKTAVELLENLPVGHQKMSVVQKLLGSGPLYINADLTSFPLYGLSDDFSCGPETKWGLSRSELPGVQQYLACLAGGGCGAAVIPPEVETSGRFARRSDTWTRECCCMQRATCAIVHENQLQPYGEIRVVRPITLARTHFPADCDMSDRTISW